MNCDIGAHSRGISSCIFFMKGKLLDLCLCLSKVSRALLICLLSSFAGGKSAFGRKSQATITQ